MPKQWPEKTEIVWNDEKLHAFRLEYPRNAFNVSDDTQIPAKVSYRLKAYDCVVLFSRPYGTAPVLYNREASAKPFLIK